MAFDIGAITGALVLDKSKWDTAIAKAKSDNKSLEGAFLRNDALLKRFGATFALTGAAITAMNVKLVTLAAGVQLTETLFSASFGKMSDSALSWSRNLSKAFQLNTSDIQKSLASMNNLAKSLNVSDDAAFEMSKSLTVMSVEMSRFFGMAQTDAAMLLQQAMAGMARGLREYGIVLRESEVNQYALNNGIIKQGESLNESQAALIRYNLLLEKMKFMHGTLAESSKNLASIWMKLKDQVNELGETLGSYLVPATGAFLKLATDLVMGLNSLAQEFPQLTGAVMAGSLAFGIFSSVTGAILLTLPGLAAAAAGAGTTMAAMAGGLAVSFLQAAAAVAALAYAIQNFDLVKGVFYSFAEGVNYSLAKAALAMANFVDKFSQIPAVGEVFKDQRDTLLRIANSFSENSKMMEHSAVDSLQAQIEKTRDFKLNVTADLKVVGDGFDKLWTGATDAAKAAADSMKASEKSWFTQMVESFNILEETGKRTFNLLSDTISNTFYDLTFKLSSFQEMIAEFGRNIIRMLFDIAAQWMAMKIMLGIAGIFSGGATTAAETGVGAASSFSNFSVSSANLPSFDSGIDYVPHDMVAKIHKGERVMTADENGSGQVIQLTIHNAITSEAVATAMSMREGQDVIINTINVDSLRNGVVRREVKRR